MDNLHPSLLSIVKIITFRIGLSKHLSMGNAGFLRRVTPIDVMGKKYSQE